MATKDISKLGNVAYTPAKQVEEKKEPVPNPEDFYDNHKQSSETKETYEWLKVYEIKKEDVWNIWFGTNSKPTDNKDGYRLSFTVNGPLVWSDGKPVWWYIVLDTDRKTHRKTQNIASKQIKDFVEPDPNKKDNFNTRNGIFGLWTDGELHLLGYEEYKGSPISFKRAFQNGPILMKDGINVCNINSTSKCNRSGIWFNKNTWDAMVIYSDEPVTPYEFAEKFKDRGCTDVIFLDWESLYAWYEDESGKHWNLQEKAIKLQFYTPSSK